VSKLAKYHIFCLNTRNGPKQIRHELCVTM
jgi:hypothetical protein